MVLEVADLAAAEHFYVNDLGMPVVERWGHDRPAVWLALRRDGFLGLWQPEAGGAAAGAIHGSRRGPHVHFAIRVLRGALDQMRRRLEALGHVVETRTFGPGDHAIYLDDPDGNVVELTERATLWGGAPATES